MYSILKHFGINFHDVLFTSSIYLLYNSGQGNFLVQLFNKFIPFCILEVTFSSERNVFAIERHVFGQFQLKNGSQKSSLLDVQSCHWQIYLLDCYLRAIISLYAHTVMWKVKSPITNFIGREWKLFSFSKENAAFGGLWVKVTVHEWISSVKI